MDILSNATDRNSKGLTMPKETGRWLVFDSSSERGLYIFFRLYVPDRDPARLWLMVFMFDIAKYQSNPLTPGLVAGDACALFCRSVAAVMRLDYMKCTLGYQAAQMN